MMAGSKKWRILLGFLGFLLLILATLPRGDVQPEAPVAVLTGQTEQKPAPAGLPCLDQFSRLTASEQWCCLEEAGESPEMLSVDPDSPLVRLLLSADGQTDHRILAAVLDLIRAKGYQAEGLAEVLSSLLSHQAAIYQERDKWQVLRLRAYLFATLSDIGFPDSALPMLVDALAYVDERMSAVEFGAAVHAVGGLGEKGRPFIPFLLRTVTERFAEEEFSLERYEAAYPPEEATTVQLEVAKALAAVCTPADEEALTTLRSVASGSGTDAPWDPRFVAAAAEAVRRIEAKPGAGGFFQRAKRLVSSTEPAEDLYRSSLFEPERRFRLLSLEQARVVDHQGQTYPLSELIDRPVLITFFYTRCQNAQKCSATIARLALLQRELIREGMSTKVRLLAITFEPEFDTPRRLRRYAVDRGLSLGQNALAIRLEPGAHEALLKDLDTPVCYNAGWVNSHGVEAVLVDAKGRLARKYWSWGWEHEVVLEDFHRLLAGR